MDAGPIILIGITFMLVLVLMLTRRTTKTVSPPDRDDTGYHEIDSAFGYKLGDTFDIKHSLLRQDEITQVWFGKSLQLKKEIKGKPPWLFIEMDNTADAPKQRTFFSKHRQQYHVVPPIVDSEHFTQFYVAVTSISSLISGVLAYRNIDEYDLEERRTGDDDEETGLELGYIEEEKLAGRIRQKYRDEFDNIGRLLKTLYGSCEELPAEGGKIFLWRKGRKEICLTLWDRNIYSPETCEMVLSVEYVDKDMEKLDAEEFAEIIEEKYEAARKEEEERKEKAFEDGDINGL